MAVYTLFNQSLSAALVADATTYTMGIQFSVSAVGVATAEVTAIWFYSPAGAVDRPARIAVFAVSGQSDVHDEAPVWSGAAGTGWIRAPFVTPVALTLGASYKACIFHNQGSNFYADIPLYWSTGAGSAGITSGPLSAPNNAGADGGQDTFSTNALLSYPATSFNATNYLMDVEVTTTAPPSAGGPPPGGGRSMLARHLAWADL